MAVLSNKTGNLARGKQRLLLDRDESAAGVDQIDQGIEADSVIVSLQIESLTGTLDLKVETVAGQNGSTQLKEVITFPQQSGPTTTLVIRKAPDIMDRIRVTATYTGACKYKVYVRGVGAPDEAASGDAGDNQDLLVDTPAISNTTLGAADSESAIGLPAGTKRFLLRARGQAKLQLAYVSGQSGTTYMSLMPGAVYREQQIDSSASVTLYVQSNKASTVVELVTWS